MEIYYQNVRGLRTKTKEVYNNVLENNYDIITFTETWLNQDVHDREVLDDRYVVYRRDRNLAQTNKLDGGGVLLAISKRIHSARISKWESGCEDIWITIETKQNKIRKKIAICVVYLPSPIQPEVLREFLDSASVVSELVDDILIIGDFNLPFLTWTMNSDGSHLIPTLPNSNGDNRNRRMMLSLSDFVALSDLQQQSLIANIDGTILDLVLTNVNCTIGESDIKLSKVDKLHPPLNIVIDLKPCPVSVNQSRQDYNFYKADFDKIVPLLECLEWSASFSACSGVDEMVSIFYHNLNSIISECVPRRKPRKISHPIWFTGELIGLLKEKDKFRHKSRKYKNPRDRLEFELIRKRCAKLIRDCHTNYINSLERNLKSDPKAFWNYIKHKRSGSNTLPSTMHNDSQSTSSGNHDIANLFGSHFSSVYTPQFTHTGSDPRSSHTDYDSDTVSDYLSMVHFSEKEILLSLKRLNTNKGPGPDGIPPLFIKRCAKLLAYPLKIIIDESLATGVFPTVWKSAKIVPVFKKGDKSDVRNYRPIAILSCFSKIFESLVSSKLTTHTRSLICDEQHGFLHKRSVLTNLVSYITPIIKGVDNNGQIDSVYTDFANAFDKVDHKILIRKLHSQFGICNELLEWLESYLKNREYTVVVNNVESTKYIADSGVPQGSHLGPILFLLFINDIVCQVKHSSCSLYADDMKISRQIKSEADAELLQQDLDRINTWCRDNRMLLNAAKCLHIRFSRKRNLTETHFFIGNDEIATTRQVRDLGVILDSKLSFIPQYDNVVNRAAKMLGFIKRNSKDLQVPSKIILYNSLVRSVMEFGSVVWNPRYAVHSQRIESVQRAFTRHLAFVTPGFHSGCPYQERLAYFKMQSLKDRRRAMDLLFLQNLVGGSSHELGLLSNTNISVPRPNSRFRNNFPFFHVPQHKTNLGAQAPLVRLTMTYNSTWRQLDLDIFHDHPKQFKSKLTQL